MTIRSSSDNRFEDEDVEDEDDSQQSSEVKDDGSDEEKEEAVYLTRHKKSQQGIFLCLVTLHNIRERSHEKKKSKNTELRL